MTICSLRMRYPTVCCICCWSIPHPSPSKVLAASEVVRELAGAILDGVGPALVCVARVQSSPVIESLQEGAGFEIYGLVKVCTLDIYIGILSDRGPQTALPISDRFVEVRVITYYNLIKH